MTAHTARNEHWKDQERNRGKFGHRMNNESTETLGGMPAMPDVDWAARSVAMRDGYYTPPAALRTAIDPRYTDQIDEWWQESWRSAEWSGKNAAGEVRAEFLKMPDDYTPKKTAGAAVSGHRRTHRMRYSDGRGFELRMPSATSVKRFAGENPGKTFDIPVSAKDANGDTITGWVRCTKAKRGGGWTTEALGFDAAHGDARAQIAESVGTILEAKRPTRALPEALHEYGSIIEKRRARDEASGMRAVPLKSTFIRSAGYSRADKIAVVQIESTKGGVPITRTYGYQNVTAKAMQMLVDPEQSPGKVYNSLMKGHERVDVTQCLSCTRFHKVGTEHVCPAPEQNRPAKIGRSTLFEKARRLRGARSADSAAQRVKAAHEEGPKPV